jgi:hypothetical protein
LQNSLTESDFLNSQILIHRQTTASGQLDYGQVYIVKMDLLKKKSTSNIRPLHAELEHLSPCVRDKVPAIQSVAIRL